MLLSFASFPNFMIFERYLHSNPVYKLSLLIKLPILLKGIASRDENFFEGVNNLISTLLSVCVQMVFQKPITILHNYKLFICFFEITLLNSKNPHWTWNPIQKALLCDWFMVSSVDPSLAVWKFTCHRQDLRLPVCIFRVKSTTL